MERKEDGKEKKEGKEGKGGKEERGNFFSLELKSMCEIRLF